MLAQLDVKIQQLATLQRDGETLNRYVQEYDEKSKEQQQLLAQQQTEVPARLRWIHCTYQD